MRAPIKECSMKTMSVSRAEAASAAANPQRALVWDAAVRVFHWLMVLCFAGAWLTADSERWRLLHVTLGYTMAGLVGFRIVWGWLGTRHARFGSFVRGPAAVRRYLTSLLRGSPEHHVGHNPAGALAIVALLGLTVAAAATGWATYSELGGEWLAELHEAAANVMLAAVGIHLAGVVVSSWLHRENLVGAMLHGRKPVPEQHGIARSRWSVALLLIALVGSFWWTQWTDSAAVQAASHRTVAHAQALHDRDDD
jgi:cytochrome b